MVVILERRLHKVAHFSNVTAVDAVDTLHSALLLIGLHNDLIDLRLFLKISNLLIVLLATEHGITTSPHAASLIPVSLLHPDEVPGHAQSHQPTDTALLALTAHTVDLIFTDDVEAKELAVSIVPQVA